jgi:hypothetical protein
LEDGRVRVVRRRRFLGVWVLCRRVGSGRHGPGRGSVGPLGRVHHGVRQVMGPGRPCQDRSRLHGQRRDGWLSRSWDMCDGSDVDFTTDRRVASLRPRGTPATRVSGSGRPGDARNQWTSSTDSSQAVPRAQSQRVGIVTRMRPAPRVAWNGRGVRKRCKIQ